MSRRPATITIPLDNNRGAPREACIGSYQVLAPLARGGTAGVYLAEHRTTGERVALKVLDPFYASHAEMVARLLGERAVSERVHHNGLLDILVADRSARGVPYLVMELLDGENLGALADRGWIELDAVIAIGAQVACAIAALHEVGVVHCDVKPDNVFVLYETGPNGWPRIKVIDYGVARFIDDPPLSDSAIAGTPGYMAPEQWRGAPVARSDVYGFGCMLYELVTGDQPFHGTLPQLMQAHLDRLPARPSTLRSELPPALDRLIVRALAKDPAMRPTMVELEAGLLALQRSLAIPLDATG